ncbi:anoctamin-1-like isoform X1 [Panulirus ornatus]|uniref:anoctamin-1-like isoform X1 n=1 Tax=Panulirus ornatus TaxID=150431 RepID=UPI003A8B18D2
MAGCSDEESVSYDEFIMEEIINKEDSGMDADQYLRDGIKTINYVLVFRQDDENESHCNRRKVFEDNLKQEGLILEEDEVKGIPLRFVKVHAPYEVCARYAEFLHLRLPMKKEIKDDTKTFASKQSKYFQFVKPDASVIPTRPSFTAVYSNNKKYLFDDDEELFTPSIRIQVVDFILRKKFEDDDQYEFGIEKLINSGIYEAAYPIHQGSVKDGYSQRSALYKHWASLSNLCKQQPLDYIKEYLGVKVAFYFAWLGFYTYMLVPASILGVLCFLYGVFTVSYHHPSNDICDEGNNVTMCPLCDSYCEFWTLEKACWSAKLTYLVDNPATILFSILMSLWARIFLKKWKRYSAEITHMWDLSNFDIQEEPPRPEYLACLSHVEKRSNPITGLREPHPPFWKMKFPRFIFSSSTVLFLVLLAVVDVLGVIIYRMSVFAVPNLADSSPDLVIFSSVSAALINLICITFFNKVYNWVAVKLTDWELQRTQTEYEDSLILKMYLLQFVNFYSSIFYIAFFKGKWVGHPGAYNRIFGLRQEECGPGGCLMELSVQLAIIMIGKQAINACFEMGVPLLCKWRKRQYLRIPSESTNTHCPQWAKDFRLISLDSYSLFYEYLEMVLQYGFVTIFVSSFPLAPMFALINNLLETRLDASKFLCSYRRHTPQRVKGIGIWFKILDIISKLAVISNGFIIAFTSNFIPEMVYRHHVSSDGSLHGFLQHSLSYFTVSDYPPQFAPTGANDQLVCRYSAYRQPGDSQEKYEYSPIYWHIFTARLAFAVIFQNVVFGVASVTEWAISDVPHALKEKIRRERHLTNEMIMKHECQHAKGGS